MTVAPRRGAFIAAEPDVENHALAISAHTQRDQYRHALAALHEKLLTTRASNKRVSLEGLIVKRTDGERLLASSRAMIRTISDDPEVLRSTYRRWLDTLIQEFRTRAQQDPAKAGAR